MKKLKALTVFFLFLALILPIAGCNNSAQDPPALQEVPETSEQKIDEPVGAVAGVEIFIPEGKSDRLPGSLKWNSIELYASGVDFFSDQAEGLSTRVTTTTTNSSTTTTVTTNVETAEQPATQEPGQTSQGSSTTRITESSGGVSTDLKVDGSVKVTTTTDNNTGADWHVIIFD